MLAPDFTKYSLALIKDNKILFSSKKSGLRPLVECTKEFKSKFKDCTLYDKVVGLAAARLIVYSAMINLVVTDLASKPAKEFLEKNNIKINAKNSVDNILRKDRKGVCPMEIKAIEIGGNTLFFSEMELSFK